MHQPYLQWLNLFDEGLPITNTLLQKGEFNISLAQCMHEELEWTETVGAFSVP